MIKIFFQRILLKILPIDVIERSIADRKIQRCREFVIIGSKSEFYVEAKVFNFRNNKQAITIGERSHIRGELLTFAFGGNITIGSDAYIGEGTRIWSAEEIIIGNDVLISHNCNIIDTDSHEMNYLERSENYKRMIEKGHSKEKGNVVTKAIHIADHVWISYNVSILKGVKIGKGAIVAAGSVVTKDVDEFSIVAGNPAVFIKSVKNEKFN
jgi:acetyltransferase-like isoleucine patch superfamily enzyme